MGEGEGVISKHIVNKNDAQSVLEKDFKQKVGKNVTEIKNLGSYIDQDDALNYFYVILYNEQDVESKSEFRWIKKDDFYERLNGKEENVLIKLLDNFYV